MTTDSSPYEKLQVSLSDLFPIDQNYAFLAGAGISMDEPTKMPSAVQMVKDLFKLVAPDEEISHILGLESLRFELAVELIQNVIDVDLKFLNFMEEVKTPNLIHYFLSRFIVKGSNVNLKHYSINIILLRFMGQNGILLPMKIPKTLLLQQYLLLVVIGKVVKSLLLNPIRKK